MFRRIFGIGRKKTDLIQNPHASSEAQLMTGLYPDLRTESGVAPLHGSHPPVTKKKDSAEVFTDAVEKLVDKLEGINSNLDRQIRQNQTLVERMDTLPDLLRSLPESVQQQQRAFAEVAEQMRQKVQRDENVARELSGIHQQVAKAAEVDTQMCDHFKVFSRSLSKLDEDTAAQTEWLRQISTTFSAGERYMQYALQKQQQRFYWVLGISLGVCLLAVLGMIVAVMLLR